MQKYFLDTDDSISGTIEGEYGTDKGVFGNATIRLYVKDEEKLNKADNFTYVMEQDVLMVSKIYLFIYIDTNN